MTTDHKGILSYIKLPQKDLGEQWDKIIVAEELKDRLLAQAILEFTVRGKVSHTSVPLHGVQITTIPPKAAASASVAARTPCPVAFTHSFTLSCAGSARAPWVG